jgi:hypothetical protein
MAQSNSSLVGGDAMICLMDEEGFEMEEVTRDPYMY